MQGEEHGPTWPNQSPSWGWEFAFLGVTCTPRARKGFVQRGQICPCVYPTLSKDGVTWECGSGKTAREPRRDYGTSNFGFCNSWLLPLQGCLHPPFKPAFFLRRWKEKRRCALRCSMTSVIPMDSNGFHPQKPLHRRHGGVGSREREIVFCGQSQGGKN